MESFDDYSSLCLIVPESNDERDRILNYIERYRENHRAIYSYDPYNRDWTDPTTFEFDYNKEFIRLETLHGVFKSSEISDGIKKSVELELSNLTDLEKIISDTIILSQSVKLPEAILWDVHPHMNWDIALKTIPLLNNAFKKIESLQKINRLTLKEALSRTQELKKEAEKVFNFLLEDALKKEGFKFKMIEAISKWDDKNEHWIIIDDKVFPGEKEKEGVEKGQRREKERVTIDVDAIKKEIKPNGYLAIDDVLLDQYCQDIRELLESKDISIDELTKEEKIQAIVDYDYFNESTCYYEWAQEQVHLAIFTVLEKHLKTNM